MTPQEYNATRVRLGLSHEALAALLGIEPQTSRLWAMLSGKGPDLRAVKQLRLIEALGADDARRLIEIAQARSLRGLSPSPTDAAPQCSAPPAAR